MQGSDGGSLVLKGYPGPVRALVAVDQDLVTVLRLDEGQSLRVDVEVKELLEAPLCGLAIEARDPAHLGGVLLIQELRALDEAAVRDRAAGGGGGGTRLDKARRGQRRVGPSQLQTRSHRHRT